MLQNIIRVRDYPRTLIEVILQVTGAPNRDMTSSRAPQAATVSFHLFRTLVHKETYYVSQCLELLPPLVNAAMLALLSSTVSLYKTVTSLALVIDHQGDIKSNPTPSDIERAGSIHALAFSSHQELLMIESEGAFDTKQWERLEHTARHLCCGNVTDALSVDGKDVMDATNCLDGQLRRLLARS